MSPFVTKYDGDTVVEVYTDLKEFCVLRSFRSKPFVSQVGFCEEVTIVNFFIIVIAV